jgi:hypothetical protein
VILCHCDVLFLSFFIYFETVNSILVVFKFGLTRFHQFLLNFKKLVGFLTLGSSSMSGGQNKNYRLFFVTIISDVDALEGFS